MCDPSTAWACSALLSLFPNPAGVNWGKKPPTCCLSLASCGVSERSGTATTALPSFIMSAARPLGRCEVSTRVQASLSSLHSPSCGIARMQQCLSSYVYKYQHISSNNVVVCDTSNFSYIRRILCNDHWVIREKVKLFILLHFQTKKGESLENSITSWCNITAFVVRIIMNNQY